jgi:Acetoacetate decarboxylase (ADC)
VPNASISASNVREYEVNLTTVPVGSQTVEVEAGGYYDRYRMNPDLDEIARDSTVGDVSWFRRHPKRLVSSQLGPMWTPNYYYRASSIQLIFLAPAARLRSALPDALEPLSPLPGKGLVALNIFDYTQCDNDPYLEAAVAIVVRKPGSRGLHVHELVQEMHRHSNYGHVLALPVTTEIARVRGLIGYQLPKWLARIDMSIDRGIEARVGDMNGREDLYLRAPLPPQQNVPQQSRLGAVHMVHTLDGTWHQSVVESNVLAHGETLLPSRVALKRAGGALSNLLDGLGASQLMRIEVMSEVQYILHLPLPSRVLRAN